MAKASMPVGSLLPGPDMGVPPRQCWHGPHTDRPPPGSSTFGSNDKIAWRPSAHVGTPITQIVRQRDVV